MATAADRRAGPLRLVGPAAALQASWGEAVAPSKRTVRLDLDDALLAGASRLVATGQVESLDQLVGAALRKELDSRSDGWREAARRDDPATSDWFAEWESD